MIFFKGNKKQNAYKHLLDLVNIFDGRNVDFFDDISVGKVIDRLSFCQYRLRIYNEAKYLNSIYLDYFNSCTSINDIAKWYDMSTDKFNDLKVIARCCHMIIHQHITTIEEIKNNG